MSIDTSSLMDEILSDLSVELNKEPDYDENVLRVKIKGAIREVMEKRNYEVTALSEQAILLDLNHHYSTILNVARYDYNQRGAEGETTHSENSVSRVWSNRDDLFKSIHAFVSVL